MTVTLMLILTATSVIASALVSGVFMAFSEFIMRSLNNTPAQGGIEAMQIINREVFRTMFMGLLIGMAVMSLILIAIGLQHINTTWSPWMISGGVVYFGVTFIVTLAGNVPLNKALDIIRPNDSTLQNYWSNVFYPRWTTFNHIRAFGAALAAICFLLASLHLAAAN